MLSENLKTIREKRRYTKTELAKVSGITSHTINALENGRMTNPRLNTLKALAKALEISVNTLIK